MISKYLRGLVALSFGGAVLCGNGCVEQEGGTLVAFDVPASATGGILAVDTDIGYRVELLAARLTVSAYELHPCEEMSQWDWVPLGVGVAHAHSESSTTRQGTPHVIDLLAGGTAGTLEPPVGRYCKVRVELAPADQDAEGVSASPDMVGHSLWLQGRIVSPTGAERPFELWSSLDERVDFDIDLPLGEAQLSYELDFAPLVESWFAGIDFDADDNWVSTVERGAHRQWSVSVTAVP